MSQTHLYICLPLTQSGPSQRNTGSFWWEISFDFDEFFRQIKLNLKLSTTQR